MRRSLVLTAALLCCVEAAHAQATRDALAEMAKCSTVVDSSERLKCFDLAVQRVKDALAEQQTKDERRAADEFGRAHSAPPVTKAEEFGKPPPPRADEITQITATVLELARTARGRTVFVLDNGQTWRQLDADSTEVYEPSPGKTMRVAIATGFLGSYNLTIEGRNGSIKVRRLK